MSIGGRQLFLAFSFLWMFFNGYLEIPLVLTGAEVPAVLLVVTLPVMAWVYRSAIKRSDIVFFVSAFALAVASVFLVPNWDDIESRIEGLLQLSCSIAIFVLLVRVALELGIDRLRSTLGWIIVLLVLVTFLERYTSFREISDEFRHLVYRGGYRVYDGDIRDLNLVGYVRPKGFTPEPSLLGLGFGVVTATYAALVGSLRTKLVLLGAVLVEWFLAGTPLVLIGLPVLAIDLFRSFYLKGRKGLAVGSLVVVVFLAGSSVIRLGALQRFDIGEMTAIGAALDKANESSERLRLVYPYLSAWDSIKTNPVLGVGVGGKRSLERYSSFTSRYDIAVGNNAFATIFIFFGAIGGVIFVLIFYRYIRRQSFDTILLLPSVVLLLNSMGGLETPRCWVYLAVLVAGGVLRARYCSPIVQQRVAAA